ncbi:hypothetical protein [Actinomycetospora atypica]|uniref:Uncharacterized protein n=1 Tax=Actinomycetospora atypica TaxID=1290095 RepID=A0ABV9YKW1_9PSEU
MTAVNAGQGHALAQLADHLGELRRCAGLTWRKLGVSAHFDHTVLWHAARGRRVPTRSVTKAFVATCRREIRRRLAQDAPVGPQGELREGRPFDVKIYASRLLDLDWESLWSAADDEARRDE